MSSDKKWTPGSGFKAFQKKLSMPAGATNNLINKSQEATSSFLNQRQSAATTAQRKQSVGNHAEVDRMMQKLVQTDQDDLDKLYHQMAVTRSSSQDNIISFELLSNYSDDLLFFKFKKGKYWRTFIKSEQLVSELRNHQKLNRVLLIDEARLSKQIKDVRSPSWSGISQMTFEKANNQPGILQAKLLTKRSGQSLQVDDQRSFLMSSNRLGSTPRIPDAMTSRRRPSRPQVNKEITAKATSELSESQQKHRGCHPHGRWLGCYELEAHENCR